MAWALSQILVVGVPGLDEFYYSESWMNYYDIFVRNAFGSFRDVLQEVTYSPMMASYLTYEGSRSYDSKRSYPDENYAREVMQLFTLGVDRLHANGSIVMEGGVEVPAYTNENIMNFARVFTGFKRVPLRSNIEIGVRNYKNRVDPVTIDARYHDKYPKPDLDGNFLGDGYPVCADVPKQAFLAKGARYEFLSTTHQGKSFKVSASSILFKAFDLAQPQATVILSEDISCPGGEECLLDAVDVIKVGSFFYEYV